MYFPPYYLWESVFVLAAPTDKELLFLNLRNNDEYTRFVGFCQIYYISEHACTFLSADFEKVSLHHKDVNDALITVALL